jgi:quercetin dioxygenase-like cupin family protein
MQRFVTLANGEGEQLNVLGTSVTVKASADATNEVYEIMELAAPPGWALPAHRHPWPEAYYVLSGRLDVQVGGRELAMTTGHFLNLPANAVHALNVSDEQTRFLIWTIGSEAGLLFRELSEMLAPGLPTPEMVGDILAIADRHRVTNVAPGAVA